MVLKKMENIELKIFQEKNFGTFCPSRDICHWVKALKLTMPLASRHHLILPGSETTCARRT